MPKPTPTPANRRHQRRQPETVPPVANGSSGRLLSTEDVADYLGVHVEHVRRMVRTGELPARRFGRVIRFDPDEIAAWVEQHRVTP